MTASEPLNGAASFDARRDQLREAYLAGINELADQVLAEFILPAERVQIVQDIALFVPFLMVVKTVEQNGESLNRSSLLSAWWPILKRLKLKVPEQILTLAKEHAQ